MFIDSGAGFNPASEMTFAALGEPRKRTKDAAISASWELEVTAPEKLNHCVKVGIEPLHELCEVRLGRGNSGHIGWGIRANIVCQPSFQSPVSMWMRRC